ncbi:hypothetical protein [Acetobacter sp. LMG 32666]|uniref:hypothetical protein n=1 Tax=Acetobacter sp. LMG 32666 TaxID=2959295 RepID=UPI0030C874A4
MKKLMCSRPQLALLVFILTGLSACAEDPHAHYYHPRNHKGQAAPDWYRPPATPQNSFKYKKSQGFYEKKADGNTEGLQYDR